MDVFGTWGQLPLALRRNISVFPSVLLSIRSDICFAVSAAFLVGFLAPASCDHEVYSVFRGFCQVEWKARKLCGSAPLHEQDLVVVWDFKKLFQVSLCLVVNAREVLSTMAHLHHTHTTAFPVHKVRLGLFKNIQRQNSWASREVEHTTSRSIRRSNSFGLESRTGKIRGVALELDWGSLEGTATGLQGLRLDGMALPLRCVRANLDAGSFVYNLRSIHFEVWVY
mmetsp:Transcript_42511/g.51615  ORF Transcript_42511/g.51615 Transcript_42511/m.51615 type:complete len:225 (-) Transcript_42511:59-733(-)